MDLCEVHLHGDVWWDEQESLLSLDYCIEFKSYLSKWPMGGETTFAINTESWVKEWEAGGNTT